MRSGIFREAKIGLSVLAVILAVFIVFYLFVSMFTSMGYQSIRDSKNTNLEVFAPVTVVIDAGHGGEDPGASNETLVEKDLNLDVSLKLEELLSAFGYSVTLTRTDDRLLYNQGEENRKKYHDLLNRAKLANGEFNPVFVSIHMNKFPVSYCKGLQCFYSSNSELSKPLAESIQNDIKALQPDNNRKVKNGNETIYLMKNLNIPAVLIECGFLSNSEESALLADNDYRSALALSIFCGISNNLENLK